MSYHVPKFAQPFILPLSLRSQSDANVFQINPTITSGDVRVIVDFGAEIDITNLPTVTPASGKNVELTLTAAEMSGSNICVLFSDISGSQWTDTKVVIQTSLYQLEDIENSVLSTPSGVWNFNDRTIITNLDKRGYTISGTKQVLDSLNDISQTQVNTQVMTAMSGIGYTTARAGYLDNLNINDKVASSGQIITLPVNVWNNATRTLTSGTVQDIWSASSRTITGGTVTTNSDKTGYSLSLPYSHVANSGIAQAGAANTITLDSSASATTDLYTGQNIRLYNGTGAGQTRIITGYNGGTKVATVDRSWITNPTSSSSYVIDGLVSPKMDSSLQVTVGINADKTGYTISGTKQILDSLNDISQTQVNTQVMTAMSGVGYTTARAGYLDNLNINDKVASSGQIINVPINVWNNPTRTLTSGTVQDIWSANSRTITGGTITSNTDKSGYLLAQPDSLIVVSGVIYAGSSTSLTLDERASSVDNTYVGEPVRIYAGSGIGQTRIITAYNGTTRISTVDRAWITNPVSGSSLYSIIALSFPKTDSLLQVTTGSNADKTGYTISGTKQILDSLNDISQTQVNNQVLLAVSGIGYTTSRAGYLDNLNINDKVASSGQMAAMPANVWTNATRTLTSGTVQDIWSASSRTITGGTITTNADKTGYTISGTKQILDSLNDISQTQVNTQVMSALSGVGYNTSRAGYIDNLNIGDKVASSGQVQSVPTNVWNNSTRTLTSGTVQDIWSASSRTITGGTITTNSDKLGYFLAQPDSMIVASGTSFGGSSTTINLDSNGFSTDNIYVGLPIRIYGGSGNGQARTIISYNGTTRISTIDRAWVVNPVSGSTLYSIYGISLPKQDSLLQVTVGANADKVGYTISGTKQILDSLNDVSQTQVNNQVLQAISGVGYTTARSVYLDNLNINDKVASSGQVQLVPSGVWIFSNRTLTSGTVQDINAYLSTQHGNGAWDATNVVTDVASGVWNYGSGRTITGGTITTNNDKTNYSLAFPYSHISASGTAQAGGASTITLDTSASSTTSIYVGLNIGLYGGTGAGQARTITQYDGSTKIATIDRSWVTNPTSSTTYVINRFVSPKLDGSLQVAVGTNADKTGYTISGTKQILDSLNDVSQAQVNNQVLQAISGVGYTTARSLYLDNLNIGTFVSSSGQVRDLPSGVWNYPPARTITGGTITTNADKTGYTISGTKQILDSLNDLSTIQVNTQVMIAMSGVGYNSSRASYLDNLNIGGNVASSTEVQNIILNESARIIIDPIIEKPATGTVVYELFVTLRDSNGNMDDADSNPVVHITNSAAVSLDSRLDSTTMTRLSTGEYRGTYTASSTDSVEPFHWKFTIVDNGKTNIFYRNSVIVDTIAVDYTNADRTRDNTVSDEVLTLINRITSNRAGYFDNLNINGPVASSGQISSLNNISQTQVNNQVLQAISGIGYTTPRAGYLDNLNINDKVASSGQVQLVPSGVWIFSNRTLTSGTVQDINTYLSTQHGSGAWDAINIISDVASGVWNFNDKTITTNLDKTGYTISGAKKVLDSLNDVSQAQVNNQAMAALSGIGYNTPRASYLDNLNIGDLVAASGQVKLVPSGVWIFANRTLTSGTIQDIDTLLTSKHGTGSWQTTSSSSVASSVWSFSNRSLTSGTVQDIDNYLSSKHGSGLWDAVPAISSLASGVWSFNNRTLTSYSGINSLTVADIDNYLVSKHGSGLWNFAAVGSYIINAFTIDPSSVPIGNTTVEARVSGTNVLIDIHQTDTSTGKVTFNLNQGQYAFYAYKSQSATFNNPTYLNINNSQSFNITGYPINIDIGASGNLVRLYAFVEDIGLTKRSGVEMTVEPSGSDPTIFENTLIVKRNLSALSDDNGYVYLDVAPGIDFHGGIKISIPKASFEKYIVPPTNGSLNVATI